MVCKLSALRGEADMRESCDFDSSVAIDPGGSRVCQNAVMHTRYFLPHWSLAMCGRAARLHPVVLRGHVHYARPNFVRSMTNA